MPIRANPNDVIVQIDLTNTMGVQNKMIPKFSQFLGLYHQYNRIYVWYLCPPNSILEARSFHKYLTDESVGVNGTYLGTAMLNARVLHVFEDDQVTAQPA